MWLALSLFATNPASAATGLVWQWPEGETRRFLVHAHIEPPFPVTVLAEKNAESRLVEIKSSLRLACTADALKKGFVVACAIEDVRFRAASMEGDVALPILDEYGAVFQAGTIEFQLSSDGRVKNVELQGVAKGTERERRRQQTLRQIAERSVAAFDLELPPKGDDQGAAWLQQQTLVTGFMDDTGRVGAVQLAHQVQKSEGAVHAIASNGQGTVGTGEMISAGGSEQPKNLFDTTISGTASFDAERGVLIERRYKVVGEPSASSYIATSGRGADHVQSVSLALLGPDEGSEDLGPNELFDNERPEVGRVIP